MDLNGNILVIIHQTWHRGLQTLNTSRILNINSFQAKVGQAGGMLQHFHTVENAKGSFFFFPQLPQYLKPASKCCLNM